MLYNRYRYRYKKKRFIILINIPEICGLLQIVERQIIAIPLIVTVKK